MIDLHTHSTASDGRCGPRELVARAAAAGVTTLALTDHDTVAGCAEAADADYLVTGNKRHFPARWKKTKVVSAREIIEIIASDLLQ